MRLIDADTLKEKLCILGEHRIERLVEKEPTVDVFDKIRDEIEKVFCMSVVTNKLRTPMEVKTEILQIIDKYKGAR